MIDSGRSTSPGMSVTLARSTIWPIAWTCAAGSINTGLSARSTRIRATCEPISPAPITNVGMSLLFRSCESGLPNDLAPAYHFRVDETLQFCRRPVGRRDHAQVADLLLDV